jgi:plasmid maintenance system antidote protein VapI
MAEGDRLSGRNGEIWRKYVRGRKTMEQLAEEYGISHQRVSQIIKAVRDSIPQETRDQLVREEVELWRTLQGEVLELWDAKGAPITAGKDGNLVKDPETGEYVRDHSGRLAGVKMALAISESLRRMLGTDAAQKVDVNVGEQAAAEEAAAEALSRLAGPDATEDPGDPWVGREGEER